jgi:hypothetical protein
MYGGAEPRIRLLPFRGVHLVSGLSGTRENCRNFRDYRESGYPLMQERFAR